MPAVAEHPGAALVEVGLTRDLSRAELATVFSYVQDLRSDQREIEQQLAQLVGENPLAALVSENTLALRQNTKAAAVTNHVHVAEAMQMFATIKKEETERHKVAALVATNEATRLRIKEARATAVTEWTPARLGAIGGLITAMVAGATALIQALWHATPSP